jgi:hypothetical protein
MSKESKKIVGFIKNLSITNPAYVAVLNRLRIMTADRQERLLSKFHGMELADFMMAVEA